MSASEHPIYKGFTVPAGFKSVIPQCEPVPGKKYTFVDWGDHGQVIYAEGTELRRCDCMNRPPFFEPNETLPAFNFKRGDSITFIKTRLKFLDTFFEIIPNDLISILQWRKAAGQ